MSDVRVFIPATGPQLAAWVAQQQLTGLDVAYAATAALRQEYTGSDDEELEYVALVEASLACLDLLAGDPNAPRKRLVVALDLDMAVAPKTQQRFLSEVRIAHTVSLDRVVSVHVDDDDAVEAVVFAVTALTGGGPEVAALTDEVAEFDLMWFDATEIQDVVSILAGAADLAEN